MTDDHLQGVARGLAQEISGLDKKQLRFNEIVLVARSHYPSDPEEGVRELVESCRIGDALYVRGAPMWQTLRDQYGWMV